MKNNFRKETIVCCGNCKYLHTTWNSEPCCKCSNNGKNKKRKLFEPSCTSNGSL